MVSEEKIFEIVDDGRMTDGRAEDHGQPISSPCEPNGSRELKTLTSVKGFKDPNTVLQLCKKENQTNFKLPFL